MQRELDEEIKLDCETTQQLVGLINDDENEVGRVHLGIVHLFTVDRPNIQARETDIAEAGFLPVTEILDDLDQYETWSKICLTSLFAG